MLNPIPQLSQNGHRNVCRALGNKVYTHALAADQPHHLLDLVHQRSGTIVEQQMRFIEKEHNQRFLRVAPLRQPLVQAGQHPEQECGIHQGMGKKFVGGKNVNESPLVFVQGHPPENIKFIFSEEDFSAFFLQCRHRPLDCADRGHGYIAVLEGKFLCMLAHEDEL